MARSPRAIPIAACPALSLAPAATGVMAITVAVAAEVPR